MGILFNDIYLLYIRELIGLIGVFIIIYGAVRSAYHLCKGIFEKDVDTNSIRLELGDTVILGLEFMVAADIIGSLESPNYYNVGLLGLIVVIRTVLSFFLGLELQALSPKKRHTIK